MRAKIELDQAAIAEAISSHIEAESGVTAEIGDVKFAVEEQKDMRGESCGHKVKAIAWVDI
jgi:hypothetical protein